MWTEHNTFITAIKPVSQLSKALIMFMVFHSDFGFVYCIYSYVNIRLGDINIKNNRENNLLYR